jgi:hypothetical protein
MFSVGLEPGFYKNSLPELCHFSAAIVLARRSVSAAVGNMPPTSRLQNLPRIYRRRILFRPGVELLPLRLVLHRYIG